MSAADPRRERLLARCERERNDLIAATAAGIARLPRLRTPARWMRLALRLLRRGGFDAAPGAAAP